MIKFFIFAIVFFSLASGALAQDFEVTGIIFEKEPYAVINGSIVKVGGEVDGATVSKILDKSVFLKYKGELLIKNLTGKRIPQENQSDVVKKKSNAKQSKGKPSTFLFALIIILIATGVYLSRKKEAESVE